MNDRREGSIWLNAQRVLSLTIALAGLTFGSRPCWAEEPTKLAPLEIGLRVHCLKSTVAAVDAKADEATMQNLIDALNVIWAPASIRFKLESLSRDDARDEAAQQEYAALCDSGERLQLDGSFMRLTTRILPELPIERGKIHLVIVHRFPRGIGGRYFAENGLGLIVTPEEMPAAMRGLAPSEQLDGQENATERPLAPKVMAHEIGHALGLLHVVTAKNLMVGGPPRDGSDPAKWVELADWQVARARQVAETGKPFLRGDPRQTHADEIAALEQDARRRQRGGIQGGAGMRGWPGGQGMRRPGMQGPGLQPPGGNNVAKPTEPDRLASNAKDVDAPTSTTASAQASEVPADVSQAWPSFRGRNASGVADGQNLPITWDVSSSTNVAWKTPIKGLGNSCPVVWGNRVFITTAVPVVAGSDEPLDAQERPNQAELISGRPVDDEGVHRWRVECYALDDGRPLWQQTAHEGPPHTRRHFKSSHANATPVTDGTHLVAFFGTEGLYCYDLDGHLLWKQDLGVIDAGAFDNKNLQWGAASSPIIYRDFVIVQADQQEDSFLAAYRISTGKLIWRTPRDERSSWSTPAVFRGDDREELITVSPNFCRGYDPRTGQELWRLGGFSKITCPTPVFSEDLIFVTSGYRPIMPIYAIRPGGSGDITSKSTDTNEASNGQNSLAWSATRGGAYIPTPILCGEYLYVLRNNGALACYEANSGKQVYEQRLQGTGGYSASLVASDDKLICASEAGDVAIVRLGPEFEVLASNTLNDVCMATPAISAGKLIFRTEHFLIAISSTKP